MRWFIGPGLAILMLVGQAQLASAQGFAPCTMSAAKSALALEWVAVRQQYEPSYQPINAQRVQTNCSRSRSESTLAPEWVAVRQQYEISYVPTCTG